MAQLYLSVWLTAGAEQPDWGYKEISSCEECRYAYTRLVGDASTVNTEALWKLMFYAYTNGRPVYIMEMAPDHNSTSWNRAMMVSATSVGRIYRNDASDQPEAVLLSALLAQAKRLSDEAASARTAWERCHLLEQNLEQVTEAGRRLASLLDRVKGYLVERVESEPELAETVGWVTVYLHRWLKVVGLKKLD